MQYQRVCPLPILTAQHYRKIYPNIQKPLHQGHVWNRQEVLSTFLVPDPATIGTSTQHATKMVVAPNVSILSHLHSQHN